MYNSKLKTVKVFLLLQYHWDKAFHLPRKFHFLVKTITDDSDRLGLVYLNLEFGTANGVMFCEIYPQSATHITTDPRFIYLFYFQVLFNQSLIPDSSVLQPAQQAFPCGLGAKNEKRESKTARKMAQVKKRVGVDLVSFLARPKPRIPFHGLSLLRNQTETLAKQTIDPRSGFSSKPSRLFFFFSDH